MTTIEKLRKMDPKGFRFIIVGDDNEPISKNDHGKAIRWAFTQRAAAESNLRRVIKIRPDARIV